MSDAADAQPARIRALVYSDAYVPGSGDLVWSLTSARCRGAFIASLAADPEWTTLAFDCGHNIPRLMPEAFVDIPLAQVQADARESNAPKRSH